MIGWVMECYQLAESVTHTFDGAAATVEGSVGPSSFATVLVSLADHLLGDLNESVEDVADGTAELTGGCVSGAWRRLNICHNTSGGEDECCCDRECFFHRENIVNANLRGGNGKIEFFMLNFIFKIVLKRAWQAAPRDLYGSKILEA